MSGLHTLQSWNACNTLWRSSRKRKLGNNTWLVQVTSLVHPTTPPPYGIKLHNTVVVVFHPNGNVTLDTGGWYTVTTKQRMNAFLPMFRVYSDKGVWYLGEVPFADGITIQSDGTIIGQGEDPKAQRKLQKQVREYAKAYGRAFVAGSVPAPNGGDCWFCLFANGKPDTRGQSFGGSEHILSHMREGYFVPSILLASIKQGPCHPSPAFKDSVSRIWNGEEPVFFTGDHLGDLVAKQVRRFLLPQVKGA